METQNETVIWSETRSRLGITAHLEISYNNGRFILIGKGSGLGCAVTYQREINGNMEWKGVIGNCSGDVWLYLRITDWTFRDNTLVCNITIWGAWGVGPWLPAGGEVFKVYGRIKGFTSREEFTQFLGTEEGVKLIDKDLPNAGT